ncbi:hypothetical protein RFI_17498 [Reticulomyxa filosa]|uniref:Uncharacterized protein n=1 Tax=Reticulomyxa filosa TaxID=46433 RepID=X6N342_RETFI|nr:hypothetical protein RFI_17498 [Reticulomyxa filosa]|eukprot:ETO19732.1 hypothetical protein RFI_17498 [Reticulomyxa filosa]
MVEVPSVVWLVNRLKAVRNYGLSLNRNASVRKSLKRVLFLISVELSLLIFGLAVDRLVALIGFVSSYLSHGSNFAHHVAVCTRYFNGGVVAFLLASYCALRTYRYFLICYSSSKLYLFTHCRHHSPSTGTMGKNDNKIAIANMGMQQKEENNDEAVSVTMNSTEITSTAGIKTPKANMNRHLTPPMDNDPHKLVVDYDNHQVIGATEMGNDPVHSSPDRNENHSNHHHANHHKISHKKKKSLVTFVL